MRNTRLKIAGVTLDRKAAERRSQGGASLARKRLFTLKEAAQYLGRTDWSMRELIWSARIPVVRVEGGRKIFLDIEDLDAFITQNKAIYL